AFTRPAASADYPGHARANISSCVRSPKEEWPASRGRPATSAGLRLRSPGALTRLLVLRASEQQASGVRPLPANAQARGSCWASARELADAANSGVASRIVQVWRRIACSPRLHFSAGRSGGARHTACGQLVTAIP